MCVMLAGTSGACGEQNIADARSVRVHALYDALHVHRPHKRAVVLNNTHILSSHTGQRLAHGKAKAEVSFQLQELHAFPARPLSCFVPQSSFVALVILKADIIDLSAAKIARGSKFITVAHDDSAAAGETADEAEGVHDLLKHFGTGMVAGW